MLITFGGVVLWVGSPATAWLTSRIERRTLLVTMLAVLALTNLAAALVPDYAMQTFVLPTSMVFAGIARWAVGAGIFVLMAGAVVVFRLGFAATNSIQQVRLGHQTLAEGSSILTA